MQQAKHTKHLESHKRALALCKRANKRKYLNRIKCKSGIEDSLQLFQHYLQAFMIEIYLHF